MMIELSPEQILGVEALCRLIEETDPLTADEAVVRQKAWIASFAEKMMEGRSFNQASGGADFLSKTEEDFKAFMRNVASDIDFHVEQTRLWLDGHWRNGDVIAPHYPKRVAIILRKARRVDLEVRFLLALSRHMDGFVVERLPKAMALQKRQA